MPSDIVARLQGKVAKVLSGTDVKARLAEVSAEAMVETPERFAGFCRSEAERCSKIAADVLDHQGLQGCHPHR